MSTRLLSLLTLLSLLVLGETPGWGAPAPDEKPAKEPTAEEIEKARSLIKDKFAPLKENDQVLVSITGEALGHAFPGRIFFAAVYPQYPIARLAPEPLKLQNVFVVGPGDKVEHITNDKELDKFFKAAVAPVKDEALARDAAWSWLRLSEELHQDKFFRFSIPEKELAVAKENGGAKVTGKAMVDPAGGNRGSIAVTLVFDADGKLTKADEKADLKAGIRPICQATKLLDPDPLVRGMAEKDILVMGRAARGYLDEQRARANPELKKAIDRVWKRIVDEGW